MKLIDRLLTKAKAIASTMITSLYSHNDDDFIQALGLNPKNYEVVVGDVTMYDSMKALNDSCESIWSDDNG
ncbi:hypothetical protein [Anaerosporobacter faecicola]|uniref:hypothetical protein n=1 Tax=Anaerosporobacter faecicola TaxID=2718714 RepID=UPI00143C42B4|nr:hypothetical protein [Anaerosporobacter faecicola]